MKQNIFNWRAFTSTYIVFSFIIMTISGLILYIAPPGRIAHWSRISLLGLEKDQWQAIHITFTFIFIIAIGFHLYFNWKPLLIYIRGKIKENKSMRREFLASFLAAVLVFVLVLSNFPPFDYVIEIGADFTDSWSEPLVEPPFPYAELMTLNEVAANLEIPVERINQLFVQNNFLQPGGESTLEEIAEADAIKPADL